MHERAEFSVFENAFIGAGVILEPGEPAAQAFLQNRIIEIQADLRARTADFRKVAREDFFQRRRSVAGAKTSS